MNEEGEQIHPRTWNSEFLDLPIVKKSAQNTPSFSREIMNGLAQWKHPRERMLFILCGAAGLRVGEALGLEIHKHFSEDFRTVTTAQKVRHCVVEARSKNENAARQVDLHPSVAGRLKSFVGARTSGFLFASRQGKPISSSNIVRRHLHPALRALNYVNPLPATTRPATTHSGASETHSLGTTRPAQMAFRNSGSACRRNHDRSLRQSQRR